MVITGPVADISFQRRSGSRSNLDQKLAGWLNWKTVRVEGDTNSALGLFAQTGKPEDEEIEIETERHKWWFHEKGKSRQVMFINRHFTLLFNATTNIIKLTRTGCYTCGLSLSRHF